MNNKGRKAQQIRIIENHLKNYRNYQVGLRNLKKQLDFIMPSMTASYDLVEGSSGTFNQSKVEQCVIDRIESRRALDLHEDIKMYELILDSIDDALKELGDLERSFVQKRYIQGMTVKEVSIELGYSEKYIFNVRRKVLDQLLISLKGILSI